MADVVETTPAETDATVVVTKSVETKVSEDSTVVKEETAVVEVNGVHNGDTPESTTAEVEVNNVAEAETAEVKQENGVEENGEVVKEETQGGSEEPTEATTVQAEGNAEAVVEEPKEEAPPKVIVHQFPPGSKIPNLSPFCLKLETFLRIHQIPYENQYGYKMGKKGKLPYIEYKQEKVADSNFIIAFLNDKFELNLDKDLTIDQLALGRAARSMLEENTYWALIYNRYVDNFNEYKKLLPPPSGAGLGFSVSQKMFQRKMRSNLDGHGLGRHTGEELYKIAKDDLKAISDLLGEKDYLLGGDAPSSFDCSVFGLCANILHSGMDSPLSTYIKEEATNLSALCDRVKESYWSDWDDLLVEKAEPALKKGFSFRKKKSKAPKQKEAPAEEAAAAPADEAPAAEENTTEDKPVENGEVPSPTSEDTPKEETQETPSEEQPVVAEEKTEVPTETTTTEVTETEPVKEA